MGLPESGWGVKDDDLFSFLADRIESSDSPYFYLALTMSSHGPYRNVPLYYKDSRFDDVQAGMERNYLLSMSYVDSALGRFFYRMGNQLDDTIVVINGDHPEYYVQDEGPSFSRSAVRDGVRRLEFVPCIIIGPGLEPVSAARAATLADLAPTVSAASGIPYLLRSIGTDLLAEAASLPSVPFTGHEYSREELYRFAESTRSTKNPEGR
jgi:phosphoglycerol transferase MdoB-like AlkP superfamily enzyme